MKQLTEAQIKVLRRDAREALEVVKDSDEPESNREELRAVGKATTINDFAKIFCDAVSDAEAFLAAVAAALGDAVNVNILMSTDPLNEPFTNMPRADYELTLDLSHFLT